MAYQLIPNWKEISEPEYPIPMVELLEKHMSGMIPDDLEQSAAETVEIMECMKMFIDMNEDNPAVRNPFNPDWTIDDSDMLVDACRSNYGLSKWNMICDDLGYGDLLMEKAAEICNAHECEPTSCMVSLSGFVGQGHLLGLSPEDMKYTMDHCLTESKYIDAEGMDYLMSQFAKQGRWNEQQGQYEQVEGAAPCHFTSEDVRFMYEHSNPESRSALDWYFEDHPFDKDTAEVIGSFRDMGAAYYAYQAMDFEQMSLDECRGVAEVSNMLKDAHRDLHAIEMSVHDLIWLRDNKGLSLQDAADMDFVKDYVKDGHSGSMRECGESYYQSQEVTQTAESKPVKEDSPLLSTDKMLASIDKARSMTPRDFYFKSGDTQVDIRGNVIEAGYEYFTPASSIYENGHLLYLRDATCVDNYHNETYTKGLYTTEEAAMAYLKEKYPDAKWQEVSSPAPYVQENWKTQWENAAYARQRELDDSGRKEEMLTRVVFKDMGQGTNKKGQRYHQIDFAYACDQKQVGKDSPMANPYLMSSRRKDASGNFSVTHSYYLSDDIYNRLMSYANRDGLDESKWTGVIAANVTYPTERNGRSRVSVDLTDDAKKKGNIVTPSEPFNEKKHDGFVKASMAEVHARRQKQMESKLPNIDGNGAVVAKEDTPEYE